MIAALVAASLALVVITMIAALAAACAGPRRPAMRHVIWTSALVASIAALAAALWGPSVTIYATAWSAPLAAVDQLTIPDTAAPFGSLSLWIGVLWAAGAAVGMLRLVRHYSAANRLRHRTIIIDDAQWAEELARACTKLGYRRPVVLRESVEVDVPLALGLLEPTLIVPTSRGEWSAAERRSVLRHELAHLANHDLWIRAIGMLACALHWFNPLSWWLAARCADESELAADARVLASGERPSTYAAALVAFAERTWSSTTTNLAVGFVRRVSLSRRVARVLTLGVVRPTLRYRGRVAVVTATCVAAAAIGLVRFEGSRDWTDDAVRGLTGVLHDPSPQVRAAAAGALGRLGRVESRAPLQRMLADPNTFVRDEARRALTHLPKQVE